MSLNLKLESCVSLQCSISVQGCRRGSGGRQCYRITKAFCAEMHLCSQKWRRNLGKLGEGLQVKKKKTPNCSVFDLVGQATLKIENTYLCFLLQCVLYPWEASDQPLDQCPAYSKPFYFQQRTIICSLFGVFFTLCDAGLCSWFSLHCIWGSWYPDKGSS